MKFTGERAVPWGSGQHSWLLHNHVTRYAWAMRFTHNRVTVDLGCGTGYGSFMLSWNAEYVLGVDADAGAIAFARARFEADNLRYEMMDIERDDIPEANVYVALETLEHLTDPDRIIQQCRPLVWSLPIANESAYHKRVYSAAEILDTMPGCRAWQASTGELMGKIPAGSRGGFILGYAG